MPNTYNPVCSLTNIANGVLLTVEDSRYAKNGTWYYSTIQEALVEMWAELFPNSDSTTLRFLKEQLRNAN